jgi:thiol-disulfide isomerase/thioredoxin
MLKKLLLGAVVVLLIFGTYCVAEAENFPVFSSKTLYDVPITSDIFAQKKITMINIWAEWCGPCISEMPDLGDLGRSMPGGSQLVGILISSRSIDRAKSAVERTNADFPHILPSSEMNPYLKTVTSIPRTIFVDSTGKIIETIGGSHKGAYYRQAIEALLEQEGGNSVTLRVDGTGGTLTTDKSIAKAGETVTVAYPANNGYELDEVWAYKTGDEETTVPLECTETECSFEMPDYPVTVAASFKRSAGDVPDYPLELPTGSGGTNNGTLTPDKTTARAGETVTIVYAADDGYEFEAITVYKTGDESTTVPLSCSGNICTFTMPDYPVTVTASFRKTDVAPGANSITLSSGTGGTLTADKAAAAEGEIVTVVYAASSGYELEAIWGYRTGNESVTVPLSCSGNICTFTMPAYPVTVGASFKTADTSAPGAYPITLPTTSVGGSITADKTSAMTGETVTLTLFPSTGYKVDTVLGYNTNNQAERVTLYFSGNVWWFTMPAYPVTIFVSFTITSGSIPTPGTPGKPHRHSGGGGCDVGVSGMGIFIGALTGAALLKKAADRKNLKKL